MTFAGDSKADEAEGVARAERTVEEDPVRSYALGTALMLKPESEWPDPHLPKDKAVEVFALVSIPEGARL